MTGEKGEGRRKQTGMKTKKKRANVEKRKKKAKKQEKGKWPRK